MVVDLIFDSVCRCLGGPPTSATTGTGTGTASAGSKASTTGVGVTSSSKQQQRGGVQHSDTAKHSNNRQRRKSSSSQHANRDAAQAVARAKQASQNNSTSKKRKATEIFRLRDLASTNSSHQPPAQSTNSFARFFSPGGPANYALCFATPIHDSCSEDEDVEKEIARQESDCNTLNTCGEDTVTSTLFFERKYAHIVESRPPMPLFSDFKVGTASKNELRKIVASDSHNSLKMLRLLDEAAAMKKVQEDKVLDDDGPPAAIRVESSCSSSSSRN